MLVILGVVVVIFLLFNVLPADPARMMLDKREDSEQLNEIKKKYALDQPVFIQFLYYINDLSFISVLENTDIDNYTYAKQKKYKYFKIFDIGSKSIVVKKPYLRESYFKKGESVSSIILSTFPNTVVLATSSMLLASFRYNFRYPLCNIY